MGNMAKVSTSEERAFKWVATLFLAFVFMACLFESIDYQRHLRAQDDTIDWEPVNATVVFSEVVWENCGEEGCDIRPKIMYEYDVDGTTTVAERITFPWDCVSDDRLLDEQQWRVVDDFPVGANATAYVDPTNQEEAVLYVGLMGEQDVYFIVEDQYGATIPFVYITPVLYFIAIRFISPIIRTRTRGEAMDDNTGDGGALSYLSSESPAEQRARTAEDEKRMNPPDHLDDEVTKPPRSTPIEADVGQSAAEQEKDDGVPFWVNP